MIKTIDPVQIYDYPDTAIIDVRTPSEYSLAHIPGAINIPLFEDDERAEVGTRYHNSGKDAGFLLGVEIVGPKLALFIKRVNSLTSAHCPLILYCWRGGMRSHAMAWLFDQAGHESIVINGGYKAFRGYIREKITNGWTYRILGGMTGAGKTETLKHMKDLGAQVLDLEAIANHKGSVFGHLGQNEQPGNEEFEILLWEELRRMDPLQPVFIEDESRSIGRVSIPEPFFIRMQLSLLFLLEINKDVRIKRLVNEYGVYSIEELTDSILKLSKYIGGDITKKAIDAVTNNNLSEAVELLLPYYDKKYMASMAKTSDRFIVPIEQCTEDSFKNAELIIQKARLSLLTN